MTLSNHSTRATVATARIDLIGNRTDTISDITLGPRESRAFPVANTMPDEPPLSVPLPVTATVTAPIGSADWNGVVYFWSAGRDKDGAPLSLDSAQQWQSQDGEWDGPDDLSATVTARYNAQRLLLHAEVTDDVLSQPYTLGETWRGDGFQFAVDPSWSRRPDTTAAVEFGLALTPDGPQVYRWTPPSGLVPGATLTVRRAGKATIYDASIPWKELGAAPPAPPHTVGLSFILNDNDGDNRQGWLAYGGGIATEKRADRYATLTLLK
jgi:hypothetical protein